MAIWLSSFVTKYISLTKYSIHLRIQLIPTTTQEDNKLFRTKTWNMEQVKKRRKIPLVSLIFLKRSLVFPILLFSSVSLHWSLRKAFFSLLAILWNSSFKWVYLSFSPLPFTSFPFSTVCKASLDNHFAFLNFFFLGMVFFFFYTYANPLLKQPPKYRTAHFFFFFAAIST